MSIPGVRHFTVYDATAAALARVADALDAEGVPYSLAYGTALGAARHRGFVPHDHDVDLFVPKRHAGVVRRIASALGGAVLQTHRRCDGTSGVQKLLLPGCLDINVFDEIGDRAFGARHPQLDRIEFCGRQFSIVRDYAEHLDQEYGPNWRSHVEDRGRCEQFRQPDLVELMPKHCVVQGVFDLLHAGHVNLLARAWLLFGNVTAVVEADRLVRQYKREPVVPDRLRLQHVASLRWVQQVICIESFDDAPSSYEPLGGTDASVDHFFARHGIDVMLCGVDDADPGYVDRWYRRARETGRLYTTDRTPEVSTTRIIAGYER